MARISVVIPLYNHEEFIAGTIASVLSQTVPPAEVVVVDDASSDRSYEAARAALSGALVPSKLLRNVTNMGLSATLNRGMREAEADWLMILASDDEYAADKVERQWRHIEQRTDEYKVCYANAVQMDSSGRVASKTLLVESTNPGTAEGWRFPDIIRGRARYVAGTLAVEKEFFQEMGGFDESLKAEDFDFQARASRRTQFAFLNEPVYRSRYLPSGLGRDIRAWAKDVETSVRKHSDLSVRLQNEILSERWLRHGNTARSHSDIDLALECWAKAISLAPPLHRSRVLLKIVSSVVSHFGRAAARPLTPSWLRRRVYQELRQRGLA